MYTKYTCKHAPVPKRRTIRGGPSNAMNMTVIRPFSRRWLIVSFPISEHLSQHPHETYSSTYGIYSVYIVHTT